jgi:hypothetical protein
VQRGGGLGIGRVPRHAGRCAADIRARAEDCAGGRVGGEVARCERVVGSPEDGDEDSGEKGEQEESRD